MKQNIWIKYIPPRKWSGWKQNIVFKYIPPRESEAWKQNILFKYIPPRGWGGWKPNIWFKCNPLAVFFFWFGRCNLIVEMVLFDWNIVNFHCRKLSLLIWSIILSQICNLSHRKDDRIGYSIKLGGKKHRNRQNMWKNVLYEIHTCNILTHLLQPESWTIKIICVYSKDTK